jgi:hypothetical protein
MAYIVSRFYLCYERHGITVRSKETYSEKEAERILKAQRLGEEVEYWICGRIHHDRVTGKEIKGINDGEILKRNYPS